MFSDIESLPDSILRSESVHFGNPNFYTYFLAHSILFQGLKLQFLYLTFYKRFGEATFQHLRMFEKLSLGCDVIVP